MDLVAMADPEITVLCDVNMLSVLQPSEQSKPVPINSMSGEKIEDRFAAVYDARKLLAVSEQTVLDANGWWREMGPCLIDVQWHPRIIRRQGIWNYLSGEYGISSERNVAVALYQLAHEAGKTPIELMNWLAK